MTNVERVERDIAREKMFREAFMNGKEPTDEDNRYLFVIYKTVILNSIIEYRLRSDTT